MLLIYGEELAGAQVTTTSPMAKVQETETSANGHYAMAQLALSASAHRVTIPLTIKTPQGQASLLYRIKAARKPSDG